MKKIVIILLSLILVGCSNKKEIKQIEEPLVNIQKVTEYDVDLTKLSKTMVYSKVYDIISSPDDYVGKKIKMKGNFGYFKDPVSSNEYFYCVIPDATACCAQGLEFVLKGDYKYPEDYPSLDDEIIVYGIFDTYIENGYMYVHLVDAKILEQ